MALCWVLGIVAVLLIVGAIADEIPAVDGVKDVLQSVVRPSAGGRVPWSSSTASAVAVADPAAIFASNQWGPIVADAMIALTVHVGKSLARPAVDVATAGTAAPVVSAIEDAGAISLSLLAIVAPILVLVALALLALLGWSLRRTTSRRCNADLRSATQRLAQP